MRIPGPEVRGTGTQNSCQPARAHQCWSAPGGGWNMEMSPGDPRLYCVDYCWWPGAGLGLSTIEICTHQDVRCEAHGCLSLLSKVQSSVGGEIKHWLSVFEQPWAQVEECWRDTSWSVPNPMVQWISEYVSEIKYWDKTSPRIVLVRYWCNSARCSI